jgi:hypothetical protein
LFSHLQAGSSPNHCSWVVSVLNANHHKQLPTFLTYKILMTPLEFEHS